MIYKKFVTKKNPNLKLCRCTSAKDACDFSQCSSKECLESKVRVCLHNTCRKLPLCTTLMRVVHDRSSNVPHASESLLTALTIRLQKTLPPARRIIVTDILHLAPVSVYRWNERTNARRLVSDPQFCWRWLPTRKSTQRCRMQYLGLGFRDSNLHCAYL